MIATSSRTTAAGSTLVPGRAGGPTRHVRTRAVLLPRRAWCARRRAAEQLAGHVRWLGVDPRRRARRLARSVVPRHVHAGPARSRLEQSRRRRRLRPDPAVLARSRRRRVPCRRGDPGRQGAGVARQELPLGAARPELAAANGHSPGGPRPTTRGGTGATWSMPTRGTIRAGRWCSSPRRTRRAGRTSWSTRTPRSSTRRSRST